MAGACGRWARAAPAAVVALVTAVACGDERPTEPFGVKTVILTVAQSPIQVGATTHVTAVLKDGDGNIVLDRVPTWLSLTPSVVSVNSAGDVTGLQAGTGRVRASSGSAASEAVIVVSNFPAAAITLGRDTATLLLPGGSVQAIAAVTDATGKAIVNPVITWTTSAPQVATVNVAGLVTAVASGTATITGSIDGVAASMSVTVRPATVAGAPVIAAIAPQTLRPGAAYVVTGANFATTPGGNQVLVDGLLAQVQTATPTQLAIVLPTTGFVCEPARTAFLQVTANGRIGGTEAPIQIASRRELAPGEAVIVSNVGEVRCNELVPATGRWVVSVYNATRNTVTPTATGNVLFAVRGIAGPPTASGAEPRLARRPPAFLPTARAPARPVGAAARRESAHVALLERNLAVLRGASGPAGAAIRAPAVVPGPARVLTTVGSVTQLKIPNVDAADFCVSNIPLGFRTAYVGPHVVIVEDTTSVLNGKATQKGLVDDYYTRIGDEFESVVWPIVATNFGNPLAMDASLGGAGRVVMVFSPRINAMARGSLLGFVASCDFFPVSQRPSSNLGAYFYAVVPTTDATGYESPDSRDQWLRLMRSTIVHELKHVAALAERVSRGLPFEDLSWEEGSARIAEEIYARGFYQSAVRGNTRYAQSIGCDIRFADPAPPCADRPLLTLRHFDGLYAFMDNPELNTALGRAFAADNNFYSGAWSVLRWAADHSTQSEAEFFREFVTSPVIGAANIEVRTAKAWEDLLGEWSLAAYLDDIGGFTPANTRLAMPSWNHPDLWLGMCLEMGPCADPSNPVLTYLRSTPFAPRQRTFGNFQVGIGSMVGGGFTLLDLSGPGSSSQVLEVKSLISAGDAPPSVRLAIARVR